jgi:7-keto-8-aminopelargonate synthetase-like enzyme
MAMAVAAIEVVEREPQRRQALRHNGELLSQGLKSLGYALGDSRSQILPLMVGDANRCMELSRGLLERGVFAHGIRPPTVPSGTSRLRITLMATHTEERIHRALEIFKQAKQ